MRLSLDLGLGSVSTGAAGQGGGGQPAIDMPFNSGQFNQNIFFQRSTDAWLLDGTAYAADEPRLEGSKGFLVEELRTRINTAPRDLTGPPWTHGTGITSVVRDQVGFDGAPNTATTVSINDPTVEGWLYETLTVTPETVYSFTFYAKQGTATAPFYAVYDATNAAFILQDVQYAPGVGVFSRIAVQFTTPANCTSVHIYPLRNAGGDGTVTVILDMVQLEAGAFPTTPILGATPNRNADVANVATSSFAYNAAQGMVVVAFEIPADRENAGIFTIVSLHDGTASNEIRLNWNSATGAIVASMTTAGVLQGTLPYIGTAAAGAPHKVSLAYNTGMSVLFGSLDGGDDEALMGELEFPSIAAMELGENPGPSSDQALNGYLSRFSYYPFAPSDVEGTRPYTSV